MKKAFGTKYEMYLLQYSHNPCLKELLNIGVAVRDPHTEEILFKGSDGKRLVNLYPTFDIDDFIIDMSRIESNLSYEDFVEDGNVSYQWVNAGVGLYFDLNDKLDKMFNMFVMT